MGALLLISLASSGQTCAPSPAADGGRCQTGGPSTAAPASGTESPLRPDLARTSPCRSSPPQRTPRAAGRVLAQSSAASQATAPYVRSPRAKGNTEAGLCASRY